MHSKLIMKQKFWLCFTHITSFLLEYRLISKKGEGTFSEVLKAQSTKTNKYVAIKCMKAHFYNIDQVCAHMKSVMKFDERS